MISPQFALSWENRKPGIPGNWDSFKTVSKVGKIVLTLSLIGNLAVVYVGYKALEYRAHINHFLDKYTHVVEEFSGRSVYERENTELQSDTLVPGRVVFIGSQLTESWDLQQSFPGFETINRGMSGQVAYGLVLRFMPDVIDLSPEVVVIEAASYNFRPQYGLEEIKDYITMLTMLARVNNVEPILTTVIPPRSHLEYETYSVNDSLLKYNGWLRAYCIDNAVQCIDYYQLLADEHGLLPERLSVSDIEPNEDGYAILTGAVKETLKDVVSLR